MDNFDHKEMTKQIQNLAAKERYQEALKLAESVNLRNLTDVKLLSLVGEVYYKNGRYREAIGNMTQAFEFAPLGKKFIYRAAEIAVEAGYLDEAEEYYEEFVNIDPNDKRAYILSYKISKASGANDVKLIGLIERFNKHDYNEEWAMELARLYYGTGRGEDCVRLCDEIIMYSADPAYINEAKELKSRCGIDGEFIQEENEPYVASSADAVEVPGHENAAETVQIHNHGNETETAQIHNHGNEAETAQIRNHENEAEKAFISGYADTAETRGHVNATKTVEITGYGNEAETAEASGYANLTGTAEAQGYTNAAETVETPEYFNTAETDEIQRKANISETAEVPETAKTERTAGFADYNAAERNISFGNDNSVERNTSFENDNSAVNINQEAYGGGNTVLNDNAKKQEYALKKQDGYNNRQQSDNTKSAGAFDEYAGLREKEAVKESFQEHTDNTVTDYSDSAGNYDYVRDVKEYVSEAEEDTKTVSDVFNSSLETGGSYLNADTSEYYDDDEDSGEDEVAEEMRQPSFSSVDYEENETQNKKDESWWLKWQNSLSEDESTRSEDVKEQDDAFSTDPEFTGKKYTETLYDESGFKDADDDTDYRRLRGEGLKIKTGSKDYLSDSQTDRLTESEFDGERYTKEEYEDKSADFSSEGSMYGYKEPEDDSGMWTDFGAEGRYESNTHNEYNNTSNQYVTNNYNTTNQYNHIENSVSGQTAHQLYEAEQKRIYDSRQREYEETEQRNIPYESYGTQNNTSAVKGAMFGGNASDFGISGNQPYTESSFVKSSGVFSDGNVKGATNADMFAGRDMNYTDGAESFYSKDESHDSFSGKTDNFSGYAQAQEPVNQNAQFYPGSAGASSFMQNTEYYANQVNADIQKANVYTDSINAAINEPNPYQPQNGQERIGENSYDKNTFTDEYSERTDNREQMRPRVSDHPISHTVAQPAAEPEGYPDGQHYAVPTYRSGKLSEDSFLAGNDRMSHMVVYTDDEVNGYAEALKRIKAIDLMKRPQSAVKTNALMLNSRGLDHYLGKMRDKVVIVEKADMLDAASVDSLSYFIRSGDSHSMLVLIGNQDGIARIFAAKPLFKELFKLQYTYKKYTTQEIVEHARKYAATKGYTIDVDAISDLYSLIDSDDYPDKDQLEGIETIVDRAIAKADRKRFLKKKDESSQELTAKYFR